MEMEVTSDQHQRWQPKRNEAPSSMAWGLNQIIRQWDHLRTCLQGSSSRNMLGAVLFLLDQVMQKTPCTRLQPKCLLWMPLADGSIDQIKIQQHQIHACLQLKFRSCLKINRNYCTVVDIWSKIYLYVCLCVWPCARCKKSWDTCRGHMSLVYFQEVGEDHGQ